MNASQPEPPESAAADRLTLGLALLALLLGALIAARIAAPIIRALWA